MAVRSSRYGGNGRGGDDHASFRRSARRLLEAAGFAVVGEAGDGAAALAAVRALRPDLVLLDVLLPDTTGFGLADVLAAEPSAADGRADLEPERGRSRAARCRAPVHAASSPSPT